MPRAPRLRTLALFLTAAATSLAVVPPLHAEAGLGAATPEALVERMRQAAATRDLVEAARCLTPEARTDMTAGMFVGAMLLVEFAKQAPEIEDRRMAALIRDNGSLDAAALDASAKRRAAAEIETIEIEEGFSALLERHGLDLPDPSGGGLDREEMTRRFLAIDQPAFLDDLMAFMKRASDEEKASAEPKGAIDLGALAGLTIEGDHAAATLGGRPIEMVRLDDRWFFPSTDVMKPGGAGGG